MKLSANAAEFTRLRLAMGWTQAQMAEAIRRTQGYVSQVEAGNVGVEESSMELLRFKIALVRPELLQSGARGELNVISLIDHGGGGKDTADGELKEAVAKLGELRKSNPEGFAAAKGVIYAIPKNPKKKKPKPQAETG